MKLHKIFISNLNSLYGEHTIDFDQDLKRAPLFLIMGPTGSGKSTILDAICVALFGKTPRLTRATGKPDMDARLLMSYGTGRCRAEVTFSLKDAEGSRHMWRAVWECRRARDKASGNLQDATRSLYKINEDDTEELVVSDSRIKYFEPHFEEILGGMTVEDFQRSILLAQGEFAAFLKADEQVKANILERLTSTDEYKLIGQRAAKKRREVDQELKGLGARLDGLPLLTNEEEADLKERIAELDAALEATRKEHADARAVRDWRQRHEMLTQTITEANVALDTRKQAMETHHTELDALAEDRRCREAQPLLLRAREFEARKVELNAQTPILQQTSMDASTHLEVQVHSVQNAQSQLEAKRKELDELKPEITRARGVQQRIELSNKEIERVEAGLSQLLGQLAETQKDADHHTADLERLQARRAQLDARQEALSHNPKNDKVLDSFSGDVSKMQELLQRLQTQRTRHTASADRVKESQEQKLTVDAQLKAQKEAIAPQTSALETAEAGLKEMMGEVEDVNVFRDSLTQTLQHARQVSEGIQDALEHHERLVEKRQTQAENERTRTTCERSLKELNKKREQHDTQLAQLRTHLAERTLSEERVKRTLVLVDHRHSLTDDTPCPLCGSEAHPYLEAESDRSAEQEIRDEVEALGTQIATLRTQLDEAHTTQRGVELEIASQESNLQHATTRKKELREELHTLFTRYNEARERAKFEPLDTFPGTQKDQQARRDELIAQKQASTLSRSDAQTTLTALDDQVTTIRLARQELDAVAEKMRALDTEMTRITSQIELLTEELHDRLQTLEQVEAQRDAQLAQLTSQLDVLAPEVLQAHEGAPDMEVLAKTLDTLEQARTTYAKIKQDLDTLTHDETTSKAHAQKSQDDLTRQQARKTELDAELGDRQQTRDAALAEQKTLLDGRHPDKVEGELDAIIKQTDAQLKMALNFQSQARNEFERARTLKEAHDIQLKAHIVRTEEATRTLTEKLKELELATSDLLAQKLLDPDRRQELEALYETLHRALDNATRDMERYREDLDKHTTTQPKHKDIFERSVSDWSDTVHTLEQELEGHIGELGALNEKAETQKEARGKAAEYKDQLDALREKSNIWETIYRLIGIKDGGSFKRFAQALNLQELVDRANVRLARLSPRYALAVASGEQGEPRLDFSVRDHHQADAERPLTTLSGGETFLVSLALALALSDFRRVEMPVETLLLDEGFGTLDQETLDVAMLTLGQLQQENVQQIGIISHVEALKERVDTRIVVEKVGNGRSRIHVETSL